MSEKLEISGEKVRDNYQIKAKKGEFAIFFLEKTIDYFWNKWYIYSAVER